MTLSAAQRARLRRRLALQRDLLVAALRSERQAAPPAPRDETPDRGTPRA